MGRKGRGRDRVRGVRGEKEGGDRGEENSKRDGKRIGGGGDGRRGKGEVKEGEENGREKGKGEVKIEEREK